MSKQQYSNNVNTNPGIVCVVGLGYVGLPLAYELDAEGYTVRGFDIDQKKIQQLKSGCDPTGDVGNNAVKNTDINFSNNKSVISGADFVIVAVPTPIDDVQKPDLSLVQAAGETVGTELESGSIVILESTVYPGGTREVFIPAIEETSGLVAGSEFGFGYSPERMNPGDEEHGLRNVVKIISGCDEQTSNEIEDLYQSIVSAGIHRAPSIETAEAAKCIENTQRDLNIALVNELAIACDHLDLETDAVLNAAGTKWNFHDYQPGLVGGHCIPVDPFYLIYESEQRGFSPELIQKGRDVNEYVPNHVGKIGIKTLSENGKALVDSRMLILGLTYKPNVDDIRTSPIGGVIDTLREFGIGVVGFDPHADNDLASSEFGIPVQEDLSATDFDGIIIGTPHEEFSDLSFGKLAAEMNDQPVVIDIDGVFEKKIQEYDVTYKKL